MAQNVKIVTQSSDVGELLKLLPSDIFPLDQDFVFEPNHNSISSIGSSQDHHLLSCMAEDRAFAQRFGALPFVEPTPPPPSVNQRTLKPTPRILRYDVPCIPIDPSIPPPPGILPLWCIVCDGSSGGIHGVYDQRTGRFSPLLIPVYTCPVYVPVQTSAGGSGAVGGGGGEGEGGIGGLQIQLNNQVSNQLLQFPDGGGAGNGGGSVGGINGGEIDCFAGGGTGVYLPRKTRGISSTAANNNTAIARKRQGVKNRPFKAPFLPKKNYINPADHYKMQEDYLNLPPPDINLPTEWTY